MDRTPQYILMNEKAPEIQKEWKPRDGDLAWHPNEGVEHLGTWEFPEKFDVVSLATNPADWWRNWLWLPFQNQLQDMVKETSSSGDRMVGLELCNLYSWYQSHRPNDIGIDMSQWPTWEQIWFHFIMWQKFGKKWDEDKWIKQSS